MENERKNEDRIRDLEGEKGSDEEREREWGRKAWR